MLSRGKVINDGTWPIFHEIKMFGWVENVAEQGGSIQLVKQIELPPQWGRGGAVEKWPTVAGIN